MLISQSWGALICHILFGTTQEHQQADSGQQECRQKRKGKVIEEGDGHAEKPSKIESELHFARIFKIVHILYTEGNRKTYFLSKASKIRAQAWPSP